MKALLRLVVLVVGLGLAGAASAQQADIDALLKADPLDGVVGKADAPITMVEYSSLTCPHCAEFHKDTLPKIKKDWVDTGKVKLVLRDFPLDSLALAGAMLAHCAGPERYVGFIETLFQTQAQWSRSENPKTALLNIARLGGIGEDKFNACLADQDLMNKVRARAKAAEKFVESTPTFFVNGKKLMGAQSYDKFEQAFREAGK